MIDDEDARKRLARIFGAVVDELSVKHAPRKTSEPQISSKIGEALERAGAAAKAEIEGRRTLPPYDIRITVQDIPDRGPGAMEEQLGADLYVNITVRLGGRPKSKGFLIQAKKSRRREGLAQQCRKMRAQTDSAYAWIYEDDGCWAIDAQTVIDHPDTALRGLKRRSVTDVFDAVLACSEGDVEIGLPDDEDETAALDRVLNRLGTPRGVSFVVTKPAKRSSVSVELRGRG